MSHCDFIKKGSKVYSLFLAPVANMLSTDILGVPESIRVMIPSRICLELNIVFLAPFEPKHSK